MIQRCEGSELQHLKEECSRQGKGPMSGVSLMLEQKSGGQCGWGKLRQGPIWPSKTPWSEHWHLLLRKRWETTGGF